MRVIQEEKYLTNCLNKASIKGEILSFFKFLCNFLSWFECSVFMFSVYKEINSFSTIFIDLSGITHNFLSFGALWQLNTNWLTSLDYVTPLCCDGVI